LITWGFYTRRGGLLYDVERAKSAAARAPLATATPAE
jgi:hypothetical protein